MRTRLTGMVAGVALALAACGGDDPATESPEDSAAAGGELVIWADPNRAAVLGQFKEQIETDLGVTLAIEEIAEDQQATFVTAS